MAAKLSCCNVATQLYYNLTILVEGNVSIVAGTDSRTRVTGEPSSYQCDTKQKDPHQSWSHDREYESKQPVGRVKIKDVEMARRGEKDEQGAAAIFDKQRPLTGTHVVAGSCLVQNAKRRSQK